MHKNNCYTFDMVKRVDGVRSSSHGIVLKVYAPDLFTAEVKVKYQNKRNKWRCKAELIDVILEKSAFEHVRSAQKWFDQTNEPPTVWYHNLRVGLGLRIQ
jgi:hypothetical protein